MTYGECARRARMKAGLRVVDLENMAGVHRGLVSKIENDQCCSSLYQILAITRALGISLNEYFGIRSTKLLWMPRDPSVSVGEYVRKIRESRHMTRTTLSEMSGVSVTTIMELELDRVRPYTHTVLCLAKALNLSPDEYIGSPCPARRRYPYA